MYVVEKGKGMNKEAGQISDGYHTFDELYEHRNQLFIYLCNVCNQRAWKSKLHDDGTMYDNYFIAGMQLSSGMITYHMHESKWHQLHVQEFEKAPKWDGHTPDDVIQRLKDAEWEKWQPIESHQTGEKVLLYHPTWAENGLLPIGIWDWVESPCDMTGKGGFGLWHVDESFSAMEDGLLWHEEDLMPTHWMPLPKPPNTKESK